MVVPESATYLPTYVYVPPLPYLEVELSKCRFNQETFSFLPFSPFFSPTQLVIRLLLIRYIYVVRPLASLERWVVGESGRCDGVFGGFFDDDDEEEGELSGLGWVGLGVRSWRLVFFFGFFGGGGDVDGGGGWWLAWRVRGWVRDG